MRLARLFHFCEEAALILLMGLLIVLAFAQIILRNLFSITLLWADPLIRHLVLWTGFLGALIATRQDKHLHIDTLFRTLSPARQTQVKAVSDLFSGLVCSLLTWVSLQFLGAERAAGTRSPLGLPAWGLELIFPLTFGLMALRFLYQSARRLQRALRGDPA